MDDLRIGLCYDRVKEPKELEEEGFCWVVRGGGGRGRKPRGGGGGGLFF